MSGLEQAAAALSQMMPQLVTQLNSGKREHAGSIFKAMIGIMAEVGHIAKDRKNQTQGYNFRGIDDVYFALQPLMIKHGVFVMPEVLSEHREDRQTKNGGNMIYTVVRMRFTFYAEDGSFVQGVTVGEGADSGDKSSNKAMSGAYKYCAIISFNIPTEGDNDAENSSPEFVAKQQPKPQQQKPKQEAQKPPEEKTCPSCGKPSKTGLCKECFDAKKAKPKDETPPSNAASKQADDPLDKPGITKEQGGQLIGAGKANGWEAAQIFAWCKLQYGFEPSQAGAKMTLRQLAEATEHVRANKPA